MENEVGGKTPENTHEVNLKDEYSQYIGDVAAIDVRKADLLAILDAVKAEGKLRTCNILLTDLKQMFNFAIAREIIDKNPIESITKRQAGGPETERERGLSIDEVTALSRLLPKANMSLRSTYSVWLILATACRVGELFNAKWSDVDLDKCTWFIGNTKNQRPHTIHLSNFAIEYFEKLASLRPLTSSGESSVWIFPNTKGDNPVDIKTFGKQLSDRHRPVEKRLDNRTIATESLSLPGGKWTAHP
jgi:integrase